MEFRCLEIGRPRHSHWLVYGAKEKAFASCGQQYQIHHFSMGSDPLFSFSHPFSKHSNLELRLDQEV
jgi:hypothetical protein